MNKFWASILDVYANVVDAFYKVVSIIVAFVVESSDIIRSLILPFVLMAGFGMFIFPPLLLLLFSPIGLVFLLIVILVFSASILGRALLNSLIRKNYSRVEFLKYKAAYYRGERNDDRTYQSFEEEYDRKKQQEFEEELRREEERRRQRQRAQEEQWRKIFEEAFGGYQGGRGGYQGGYQQGQQGGYNPFSNFKKQYEDACDVLGVSYNSDYQTIKSKYRQLAKKYHPDLSKESNADEMFKKINNAFDFLSEENVNRYRNL